LVLLLLALAGSGCSNLVGLGLWPTRAQASSARNPVVEIICLWDIGEGIGLDQLPARGFAGQVLFFGLRSHEPLKVDGDVTVYVFDNVGSVEEQGRPLNVFPFASAEWNSLRGETNLGTAYQMFVPYTRKGNHEAVCSLRVKFTPADGGPPVYSRMANVTLPGANSETKAKRWEPEHRQIRSQLEPTGETGDNGVTPAVAWSSHGAVRGDAPSGHAPIQLFTGGQGLRARQAQDALARLRQVAAEAQFGDSAEDPPGGEEEPPPPRDGHRLRSSRTD
jgi:hypothetical protein